MRSSEIRQKFLNFFKEREHTIVPSSSLIPDDPSVLFTTAGMQQFKPYFVGRADPQKDFGSLNTASSQKCFRTTDIDAVGDSTHLTFFEMLGNFSFGGYFKKEAIHYAHEFLSEELGLTISYVSIFGGSDIVPRDQESYKHWKALGVADIREEGMEEVFWGPTGNSGPCGPTTEIYCKTAGDKDVEVWNIVFNEFFFPGTREELLSGNSGKKLELLKTPGIDTGMGFERLMAVLENKKSIFETDLFNSIAAQFSMLPERERRIAADHLRAAMFLVADGIRPSNVERGYVLRRLIRRMSRILYQHGISPDILREAAQVIFPIYADAYPELETAKTDIKSVINEEHEKFSKALKKGLKEFERMAKGGALSGKNAFDLYQNFGFPVELTRELTDERGIKFNEKDFTAAQKEHRKKSRAGLEKKFGGHGLMLDTGELKAADDAELRQVTRLHTATHLLQAALRQVLGKKVRQMGSDITRERTRFDFTFPRKIKPEELRKVETLVNSIIQKNYVVEKKEMSFAEAAKSGALYFFKEKYPDVVRVYSVVSPKTGEVFSREFCGGPHVASTGEIGTFAIIKEEGPSAGVRRVRATVTSPNH